MWRNGLRAGLWRFAGEMWVRRASEVGYCTNPERGLQGPKGNMPASLARRAHAVTAICHCGRYGRSRTQENSGLDSNWMRISSEVRADAAQKATSPELGVVE